MKIEQVEATLLEHKIEPGKVSAIIKDLEKAAEEEKEDNKANAGPKLKWEHVVILNDPDGKIQGDYTAWVVTQKEGQDAGLVIGKLTDSATVQNENTKKKKNRITGFANLFELLKPKFTKEKGVKVKTKEPVRVLVVNGKNLL